MLHIQSTGDAEERSTATGSADTYQRSTKCHKRNVKGYFESQCDNVQKWKQKNQTGDGCKIRQQYLLTPSLPWPIDLELTQRRTKRNLTLETLCMPDCQTKVGEQEL